MKKLDPNSAMPLYRQLTKDLIDKIDSNAYQSGDKIPSIRRLAKQYQVSNITVIRALEELRQHRYIYSIQGKGYYIAGHQIIHKYMPTQDGFSDLAEKEDAVPSSTVLRKEIQQADPKLSEMLGVEEGEEIVLLERIRRMDGFPLCLQVSYLPHELCPDLLNYDFEHFSLYHVLRENYHLRMAKSQYTIQAGLAEAREIKHLNLDSPAAILWVRHWAFNVPGRLFEYGESAYRADCFQINSPVNDYEIISELDG